MSNNAIGSFTDNRDGKTYSTVQIGNQIWMSENLDYAGNGGVYFKNASSPPFAKAGRLYTWQQAMVATPSGWHLPTQEEWEVLTTTVGGCPTAGKHLKATNGWKPFKEKSGNSIDSNGLDTYGFAALPGGLYKLNNTFSGLGSSGYWWSATEIRSTHAQYRYMHYADSVHLENGDKSRLFSVRCLKD